MCQQRRLGLARLMAGIIAILAVGGTAFPPCARAGIIYSEDFESLSDGELVGQGGWYGDSLFLSTSGALSTRIVDGFDVRPPVAQHTTLHSLALPSFGAVVASVDAYASSSSPKSHNSGFALIKNQDHANSVAWWEDVTTPRWYLRVAIGSTNQDLLVTDNGFDKAIELHIVLDYDNNEVYGRYDFGSGFKETARVAVDGTALRQINGFAINQDFRWVGASVGIQLDNILVQSNAVPEPSTWYSFAAFGLLVGGAMLQRSRRAKQKQRVLLRRRGTSFVEP